MAGTTTDGGPARLGVQPDLAVPTAGHPGHPDRLRRERDVLRVARRRGVARLAGTRPDRPGDPGRAPTGRRRLPGQGGHAHPDQSGRVDQGDRGPDRPDQRRRTTRGRIGTVLGQRRTRRPPLVGDRAGRRGAARAGRRGTPGAAPGSADDPRTAASSRHRTRGGLHRPAGRGGQAPAGPLARRRDRRRDRRTRGHPHRGTRQGRDRRGGLGVQHRLHRRRADRRRTGGPARRYRHRAGRPGAPQPAAHRRPGQGPRRGRGARARPGPAQAAVLARPPGPANGPQQHQSAGARRRGHRPRARGRAAPGRRTRGDRPHRTVHPGGPRRGGPAHPDRRAGPRRCRALLAELLDNATKFSRPETWWYSRRTGAATARYSPSPTPAWASPGAAGRVQRTPRLARAVGRARGARDGSDRGRPPGHALRHHDHPEPGTAGRHGRRGGPARGHRGLPRSPGPTPRCTQARGRRLPASGRVPDVGVRAGGHPDPGPFEPVANVFTPTRPQPVSDAAAPGPREPAPSGLRFTGTRPPAPEAPTPPALAPMGRPNPPSARSSRRRPRLRHRTRHCPAAPRTRACRCGFAGTLPVCTRAAPPAPAAPLVGSTGTPARASTTPDRRDARQVSAAMSAFAQGIGHSRARRAPSPRPGGGEPDHKERS